MRFLKILIVLLLFEEYQCEDIRPINATHCEYSKKRQIPRTRFPAPPKVVTFLQANKTVGSRLVVGTTMKPAYEIVKKIKCCRGYKEGRGKTCIPQCDQICENGMCSAPNECSCKKGFKKMSPSRCVPHCESCNMGHCVKPNRCECYSGYHKNETGQCVPQCSEPCLNGWCSQPDVCSCNPGYELDKMDKYKCYANCTSPCIQGRCIAPDVCDCHPGYEFKNGSKNECLPICDFCESGNCTGPSKCTCWNNYEEQEIAQGAHIVKICQPKCMDECINGVCIEVDTCSCNNGYEFVENSFNVCEAVCNPPCDNGDCIAPGVCSCDFGFKLSDGQCQAHCDNECVNGFCVYPNQCECKDGYAFTMNTTNVCAAVCENCSNGICVEPNVCECSAGFRMNGRKECVKMCVPECIPGKCVDGICICDSGLQLYNGMCVDITTTELPKAPTTTELQDVITTTESQDVLTTVDFATGTEATTTTKRVQCSCEDEECKGANDCRPVCGINNEVCINGTCVPPGISIESASVYAYMTDYKSLIIAAFVAVLTITTIIMWLSRQNRKVNYNVDEKERKVGVNEEDYVHYIINKDDNAFA